MTPYEIICEDLSSSITYNGNLTSPSYGDDANEKIKISITSRYLKRALRLKHRRKALTYAYYLGKIIEENNFPAKEVKQIISDHYYITSISTYYIFESNPGQIEKTETITLSLIHQLTARQYQSLIVEL